MSLAAMQQAFLSGLVDPEDGACSVLPASGQEGFAIYRNAYRTVMVEALADTFSRTLAYAGEDSFRAAATHHVIAAPPSSWSLDHAGLGFDATCTEIFSDNPEVAELAALEWAMHEIFVCPDVTAFDANAFGEATAAFGENDWASLQLDLVPLRAVPCRFDLLDWWKHADGAPALLPTPGTAIVWREGERPVFKLIDRQQAAMLGHAGHGMVFGEFCEELIARMPEEEAIPLAAAYLQGWLAHRWIAGISLQKASEGVPV